MSNIIRAKCLVIGDSTAGKTSLVQKFISEGNQFPKNYNMIKSHAKGEDLKGVLFANKADLTTRRLISPKAGRELAQKLGLVYFEGSAKDHSGVEDPFFFLVNEWFKIYTDKTQALKLLA
ncbi:Intraflagellar transport protein 27-like [Homarus americanus]|uniref:Intraflagellar transport protein 27-like n=1 Tax=Homarus americanus TaxID=6706 RepID=A0A8J5JTE1_HOMAM|nr:Intraflagellar transport protein 27-like [Homarus americanus]